MTSIDITTVLNIIKDVIDENNCDFNKKKFYENIKSKVIREVTPLLKHKPIKVLESIDKKTNNELYKNINKLKTDEEIDKYKVETLKEYCKYNGISSKSTFRKKDYIDNIKTFNMINKDEISQYFTINNRNIYFTRLNHKLHESLYYKNLHFHGNITKHLNELKRFSSDILDYIYYHKYEDYFVAFLKDEKMYYTKIDIDSNFKLNINKNYIIDGLYVKACRDFIRVF